MDSINYYTTTSDWQAILNQAVHSQKSNIDEHIKGYIIHLLIYSSFQIQQKLSVKDIAIMDANLDLIKLETNILREIADKCLLYAGLFPEKALTHSDGIQYFTKLGQSAYQAIARRSTETNREIYEHLSHKFLEIIEILHELRELTTEDKYLDPINAMAIWEATGSQYAYKYLLSQCKAAIPMHITEKTDKTYH